MKSAKILCGALTLVGLMASPVWAKDWTTIRIGSEGAYPPFNYFNTDGELVGFDIDIGRALCEKLKAECTFVSQDWDGMIPALLSGKYDVILASMSITEERKKQVDFTDPYYKAALTFVGAADRKYPDLSPQALEDMSLGALSASTQAEFLQANYPDSDLRLYRTQDEVNLDLINGRLDLQVSDLFPMLDWVTNSEDGSCCQLVGNPITEAKYAGEGTGMAVRQEDDELREKLNAALAEIVADGTYKAINAKYFPINIYDMK
ncbi:ABC transporter substrate-binding protein [Marinobacterium sp. D7]|uniref:ABC transporter substrate-binding protein n=1 Tax=Marinobacterium ramblicola TaxID=2849041 RepID=UPI001C2DE4DA|nr:ABC transporter substrate-binding protein [Marinobacterium ramblicola]MBV1787056.1 ABC transporter substrate-binding protein [Marinobacterium ramblicola]